MQQVTCNHSKNASNVT